jgi:GDPmannose 4,6-dehydratase
MKRAFITGITGQDGSYLAELLLAKGYEVHGLIRRASTFNPDRIDHIYQDHHLPHVRLYLHYGDLSVSGQTADLIHNIKPDEIYHLGAQNHVRVGFDMPEYTGDVTGLGTARILEAIRKTGVRARFYQASSGDLRGLEARNIAGVAHSGASGPEKGSAEAQAGRQTDAKSAAWHAS